MGLPLDDYWVQNNYSITLGRRYDSYYRTMNYHQCVFRWKLLSLLIDFDQTPMFFECLWLLSSQEGSSFNPLSQRGCHQVSPEMVQGQAGECMMLYNGAIHTLTPRRLLHLPSEVGKTTQDKTPLILTTPKRDLAKYKIYSFACISAPWEPFVCYVLWFFVPWELFVSSVLCVMFFCALGALCQ